MITGDLVRSPRFQNDDFFGVVMSVDDRDARVLW